MLWRRGEGALKFGLSENFFPKNMRDFGHKIPYFEGIRSPQKALLVPNSFFFSGVGYHSVLDGDINRCGISLVRANQLPHAGF